MSNRGSVVCALLLSHTGLLAWSASQHSPTLNEPGLLAAGLSHWQSERFELYRVNPPLVRMVACLPLIAGGASTDWSAFYEGPGVRAEFAIGADFVGANGPRTVPLTTFARWACIPFSLIGASICYVWARELYGTGAGLLATTLWCISPTILGHGSLVTTDVPCAALAAAASYSFWHCLRTPSWGRAGVNGVVLGLAELTKMTLVILYPLWLFLWITLRWWRKAATRARNLVRDGIMLCVVFLTSLYVINVAYLFEGSFTRLADFQFVSDLLRGDAQAGLGNRFASPWLGSLRVPLPKNYVLGGDLQRHDFERSQMPSYLGGRFQLSGWWYYYIYALAVKMPLGTWGLLAMAVILRLTNRLPTGPAGSDFFLLATAGAILAFVSSQSGFSGHSRYAIAILPFIFVWISQVARSFCPPRLKITVLALGLLAWSVVSSLACYPHSLSYFNELAGGPTGGHRHLLGSDLDWGQDLLYLKKWLAHHPGATPLHLSCVAMFDPKHLGIDCLDAHQQWRSGASYARPLRPGWYAISINDLCRWRAMLAAANCEHDEHSACALRSEHPPCALYDLANQKPVAIIGYTIYLFHVRDPGGNG